MQILRMMICLFMINGTFVLKPIYAQEHWGKEDSIKLSKMLNGEMPIYNDEWKKYLNFKQSLTYHWLSPIDDDILTNHFLQTYNKRMNDNLFFMNNQIINISQYSNMSIPLAKRIHFNVYGIKELSEKKVLPHPISFFPYEFGAGFSYDINRHLKIGTQSNYQYNSIHKKWEWFMGLGIVVVF